MCGIVAAIATGNIVPVLIEGLNKLEYRGYDSAGIALLNPLLTRLLTRLRSVGRVAELAAQADGLVAHQGIAHTRWATHGVPSERNAHPHVSAGLAVVHNGIIENYAELKQRLVAVGYPAGELKHGPLALVKGTDVDKPRNLAKSVTVE